MRKKEMLKKFFVNDEQKNKLKRAVKNNFGIKRDNEIYAIYLITGLRVDWDNLTKKQFEIIVNKLKQEKLCGLL